jgi:hypothetical protein
MAARGIYLRQQGTADLLQIKGNLGVGGRSSGFSIRFGKIL